MKSTKKKNTARSKTKKMSSTSLKANLLLLLVSILIFMIFFEIALRIIEPKNETALNLSLFVRSTNPLIIYEHRPNFQVTTDAGTLVTTNNLGLRDDANYTTQQLTNNKTILLLGDSVTAALDVPNNLTFAVLLEKQFNDTIVLNAGVNGYGIGQEIASLQNYLNFSPNIVILNYVMNDPLPSPTPMGYFIESNRECMVHTFRLRVPCGMYEFVRSIHSIKFIFSRISRIKTSYIEDHFTQLHKNDFANVENGLDDFARLANEQNFTPYIAIYPLLSDDDRWDWIYAKLRQEAQNRNITIIDLTNDFADDPQSYQMTYNDLIHLNTKGHLKAANALHACIVHNQC